MLELVLICVSFVVLGHCNVQPNKTMDYNGTTVLFFLQEKSFSEANQLCQIHHNASLVFVKNEQIQMAISNELNNFTYENPSFRLKPYHTLFWVGAKAIASRPSCWHWLDGSTLSNGKRYGQRQRQYHNWFLHEPSYGKNNTEYCLGLTANNRNLSERQFPKKRGGWVDDECTKKKYFICRTGQQIPSNVQNDECVCEYGYYHDGSTCADIDECSTNNSCSENSDCTNTNGSYNCQCHRGYSGNGKTCADINECENGEDICHQNADCINTNGSFVCQCKTGYSGNGSICYDLDECAAMTNACQSNEICSNTEGSYTCHCVQGFERSGNQCIDINECEGTTVCPHFATCHNTVGGFHCNCSITHYMDGDNQCIEKSLACSNDSQCAGNATCLGSSSGKFCECNHGYDGFPVYKCIDFCKPGNVEGFNFPRTRVDTTAFSTQLCPKGFPMASAVCNVKATETDIVSLFSIKVQIPCNTTLASSIILTNNITSQQLESHTAVVELLASNSSNLNNNDTKLIVDYLSTIQESAESNQLEIKTEAFKSVVSISVSVAEGLGINNTPKNEAISLKQRVAKAFSSMLQTVILENEVLGLENDVLSLMVSDQLSNLSISFSPEIIGSVARPVKIVLPAAALKSVVKKKVKRSTGVGSVRSSFVWYQKNLLFDSPENATSIVSADLGLNIPINNLPEPVVIEHDGVFAKHGLSPANNQSLTVNKTQLSCVYWDFDTRGWETAGCWLNYTSDKPVCLCSHLTNFALLVTTIQVPSGTALSVVSDIGCVISIVGLFLTIIAHLLHRDTRNRRPAKILLNICSNLLIAYFIFVVGVSQTSNRTGCKVVAVLLHYFFLTTWCWMSVYSYDMYMSLVKVFHKSQHQFLQRTSLFAYVVPFVIVVISASVTMGYLDLQNEVTPYGILEDPLKSSSYISDHMCWLRGNSLYFSFLLPVGMMLIFNIFVFVSVSRELALKNKSATSPNLKRSTKQSLTIAITMTSLMGLTWVLGYFILVSTDVVYVTVFSWLFALFNTLQGFFIFYLTSVRRSDMRSVWLRPFRSYRSSDLSADNAKTRSKSTYSLKETAAADSTEKTRKTTFTQI